MAKGTQNQNWLTKSSWDVHSMYVLHDWVIPTSVTGSAVWNHERRYRLIADEFFIEPARSYGRGTAQAPFLAPEVGSTESARYNPLEVPLLHRRFALIESVDDCLEFASEFGMLGVGLSCFNDDGDEQYFEPHNLWLSEAATFRFWLALTELNMEKDPQKFINRVIELCAAEFRLQDRYGYLGKNSLTISVGVATAAGGLLNPARGDAIARRAKVNKAIYEGINGLLADRVDVQVWPTDSNPVLVVRHLLGAMTLSLLNEVMGTSHRPKKCEKCKKLIYRATRSDLRFCCSKCRVGYFREEKAAAKRRLVNLEQTS